MRQPERNSPCPCGSRTKYKHCCRLTQDPLEELYQPRPGDRVRGVIDWYEVHDLEGLARQLALDAEVVGSEKLGWSRFDRPGEPPEPSATLVLDDEGRLEVETATELTAETTRWWLERIAGECVTHDIGRVCQEEIGSRIAGADLELGEEISA